MAGAFQNLVPSAQVDQGVRSLLVQRTPPPSDDKRRNKQWHSGLKADVPRRRQRPQAADLDLEFLIRQLGRVKPHPLCEDPKKIPKRRSRDPRRRKHGSHSQYVLLYGGLPPREIETCRLQQRQGTNELRR